MTSSAVKLPFYAKLATILIGLYFLVNILVITKDLILPVIYAVFFAILMNPAVNFLVRRKLNLIVAISLVLSVAFLLLVGFVLLVFSQATLFAEAWPELELKFNALVHELINWFSGYFNISINKINGWIYDLKNDLNAQSGSAISTAFFMAGKIFATAMLTLVYVFLILYYQSHLIKFIHKLFGSNNDGKVNDVLEKTQSIIQLYIIGLFAEIGIVAILNSVGLLLLGIKYAVLLGVSGALLNIIPYLGGLITMSLFMIIALLTKTPIYVLYVLMLYSTIQFIDNNLILPKIVGFKVSLNAFVSIIAVILGGALWGIPGMFIIIPLAATVKIIFDHIEPVKPWGFLMGLSSRDLKRMKHQEEIKK
jgi:predicted PurR-regulated permease PerM